MISSVSTIALAARRHLIPLPAPPPIVGDSVQAGASSSGRRFSPSLQAPIFNFRPDSPDFFTTNTSTSFSLSRSSISRSLDEQSPSGSSGYAPQYYRDSIAIGSFGAMQHGILVSCSAGNSGPDPYTATKYRDLKIEEPFPCRPFSFKFTFNFTRKPTILLKNVADDCAPFC